MIQSQASRRVQLFTQYGTAVISGTVSLVGADYGCFVLTVGASPNTSAGFTVQLLHSDTTTFATTDAVLATRTESANTDAKHMLTVHFSTKGIKKNLKYTITPAATTNDKIAVSGVLELFQLEIPPQNTTDMTGSTNDGVVIV